MSGWQHVYNHPDFGEIHAALLDHEDWTGCAGGVADEFDMGDRWMYICHVCGSHILTLA